jgi:hypothetical protein
MTVAGLWRLWALTMAAVVLAWWTFGQPRSDGGGSALVRPATRMPALPAIPVPPDPEAALAKLAQSSLWGPPAPRPAEGPAAAKVAAPTWKLSGFYEAGGVRHVIVSFDAGAAPSQQLRVGDRLPNGATVVAIEPDRVRARKPRASKGSRAQTSSRLIWLPISSGLPMPTR